MPMKGTVRDRGRVYWWMDEVVELRRECIRKRRQCTRENARHVEDRGSDTQQPYREAKNMLREAIQIAKREKWRELCRKIDEDVWRDGYRVGTKRMRILPPAILPQSLHEIIEALFPKREKNLWSQEEHWETTPFTGEQLRRALDRLKTGRATRPDEIPPEIIKLMVAGGSSRTILEVMNGILQRGEFPDRWKRARLVLIRKGTKPLCLASSYRPVCLLDAPSKLLEYLLLGRLEGGIERTFQMDSSGSGRENRPWVPLRDNKSSRGSEEVE